MPSASSLSSWKPSRTCAPPDRLSLPAVDVTILGGTGALGGRLSRRLVERGHRVTVTGRLVEPTPGQGLHGVRLDLSSGDGIAAAISGADVVVHSASDPARVRDVDLAGTERLLEQVGGRHLVYVSIVGVDRHPLPYYQGKFATEQIIEARAAAFSIVRATQFHDLIADRVDVMTRRPLAVVPKGFVYQPIDLNEVAEHLVTVTEGPALGRAPDFAGPEVLGIESLARSYMAAIGRLRPLIPVRRRGPVAAAYRAGAHTNPERAVGSITWQDHLQRRFGSSKLR